MSASNDLPATKSDVQAVRNEFKTEFHAVRKELKAAETRLDQKIDSSVQRLDQKIDGVHRSLAIEIVKTHAKIDAVSDKLAGIATKDDVNRIMNAIDKFAEQAKHYERADVIRGQTLVEVEIKIKDHDQRIKALESARR